MDKEAQWRACPVGQIAMPGSASPAGALLAAGSRASAALAPPLPPPPSAAGLSEAANEVLQLTQEALNLAQAACHLDKAENFVGAYDYYDKAILNIDEVMSKLPPKSSQWSRLLDLRCQYDDRMEQLKDMETRRYRSNTITSERASDGGDSVVPSGWTRRQKAHEEMNFKEMSLDTFTFLEPPPNPNLFTFWLLSNIKRTIETGGYLTSALFVPSKVWEQSDVKLTGLGVRTTAFEIIIKLIDQHFYTLYLSPDEDSLFLAEEASLTLSEELQGLQNQLSKPFNFIKEIPKASAEPEAGSRDSVSLSRDSVTAATGADAEKRHSNTKSLTGYVAALGKNMRKYAEVGLSRLAVALPSKLSAEELADYRALVVKLCVKTQLLADWVVFASALLQGRVVSPHAVSSAAAPVSVSGDRSPMNRQSSSSVVKIELCESAVHKAEALLANLKVAAQALRDVVCEILLRDVEYLLDKHLIRTRKTFSRMYWDDEGSSSATSADA